MDMVHLGLVGNPANREGYILISYSQTAHAPQISLINHMIVKSFTN